MKKYEKKYQAIEKYIDIEIPDNFDFYNNTATNVFFLLEQSGLGIYYDAFNKMFNPKDPTYSIINNTVLTSYNLYNVTSRPTNAFNSVNFAAIPKGRDFRSCFIPRVMYFLSWTLTVIICVYFVSRLITLYQTNQLINS